MNAGRGACASKRDDLGNFSERETQPTRAGDKGEEIDRLRWVQPIPGRRAAWRWQDASGFV